jgi:PKD repeat protein
LDFGNGDNATTTTPATSYTYADSGTYVVKLVTQHYCGKDTAIYTLVASKTTTGIAVLRTEMFELNLAPNPFSEVSTLLISPSPNEPSAIKLFGTDGRLIRDLGTVRGNSTVIKRENLAAGQYVLQVEQGQRTRSIMLIVE